MSVEDDITQLQADVTALQGTLETIRQSLQDQIDLNEVGVTDADTTADAAVVDTITNAQDISALDTTLRLYIDSKVALMRSNITSDFSTTLSSVAPQIESDVTTSFNSQITSVNATITTQASAAASSAYDANQSYLSASSVFTSLVQTDIPALQARVTATEGDIQTHTNDWTSLLSQYGYTSIQQGFDAQVISTNSAIATAATNLQTAIEDPAGTSVGAQVATQQLAITDLEQGVQAGFLVKAQVDANGNPTAVSLLELIAADGTNTQPVSIAKLQADEILLDGTVTAKKLVISDFTDYAQLPKFENADWDDHWTLVQTYGSVSLSANTGFLGNNALEFAASSTSTAHVRAQTTIDVEPNKQYQVEMWARRSSNYAPKSGGTWGDSYLEAYEGTTTTALTFTLDTLAGTTTTATNVDLDPQQTNQTDFYKISGMIDVPDDVNQVTFKFTSPHSAGVLKLSSLKVISKLGGELVIDGSITNAKIADTIQSANYSAGSAGWKIDKTGDIELNDATFRGTLDVRSATSGQRMEIDGDQIKVYDSSNVVRVKIGNL
jgi:hypothetical protein